MLSYLYRLATRFESDHGYRANLLYLNPAHFQRLRTDLAAIKGLDELVKFLGMEIIVERGVAHPHVAYSVANRHMSMTV